MDIARHNRQNGGILTRTVSRGDSWTHQLFIPRPIEGGLRQAITPFVRSAGCDGPGQVYHRSPIIVRRTRRYVVVHQTGGYDI